MDSQVQQLVNESNNFEILADRFLKLFNGAFNYSQPKVARLPVGQDQEGGGLGEKNQSDETVG